jgi:hypothetical protein
MEIKKPLLKAGTTVRICVKQDCTVEGLFIFDCTVFLEGTEAAAAKLTVMDVDDLSVLTKGA